MNDLETKVHDELVEVIDTYRPSADLPERIRRRTRRRRRRVMTARVTTIVLTLVVIGGVVAATRSSSPSSSELSTSPTRPPTAGAPPVTLPAVSHAPGAKPVDFDGYRVWVPANYLAFSVGGGLCGAIDVMPNAIAPQPPTCGQIRSGQEYLQLTPLVRPLIATTRRTHIDGYEAWGPVLDPSDASFEHYDVPALGVRVLVRGAGPQRVLATLGPSSRSAVFATRPRTVAPAGWHTVRYKGVELRVPPSWPVKPAEMYPCSPLPSPAQVWLGPATGAPGCPGSFEPRPPADGLWLQPSVAGDSGSVTLVRDGAVKIYDDGGADPIAQLGLVVGDHLLQMTIGLGTDPSIAEYIIDSVRPA